ncbi:DinB family protein [Segetibacter koreensis]|uniref:DinB family protein n=1 Tax=Segetibacter koreensis TaxID=398037 RepID=UPI0003A7C61D|nr:DinB family protein [Segetibacter koreensis]
MQIIPLLLKEMEQEAAITRKMLERVPDDKFDWKPHEKSMTLKQLTVHIAELPSWVKMALTTSELDFSKMDYTPTPVSNTEELISVFEKSLAEGKAALSEAKEEDLLPTWTLRNGEKVFSVMTKYEVIRHSFAQTTHHRAQLGVYLRLLNIPIPGSYGPSADEPNF